MFIFKQDPIELQHLFKLNHFLTFLVLDYNRHNQHRKKFFHKSRTMIIDKSRNSFYTNQHPHNRISLQFHYYGNISH